MSTAETASAPRPCRPSLRTARSLSSKIAGTSMGDRPTTLAASRFPYDLRRGGLPVGPADAGRVSAADLDDHDAGGAPGQGTVRLRLIGGDGGRGDRELLDDDVGGCRVGCRGHDQPPTRRTAAT